MILIDPSFYWEFRARATEHQLAREQLRQAAAHLERIRRTIETKYPAVDLSKSYRWDDERCALWHTGQDLAPVANP